MDAKGRVRALVSIGIAAAFVLLASTAILIAVDGFMARPRPADLAIVFGNQVERTGCPSKRLAARLDAALGLYRRGLTRVILVSGGTGVEGFDESHVMRDWLIARGVPDSVVVADPLGLTTARTCENAATLMRARGLKSATVVSQWFHLRRARLACVRAGVPVVGSAPARYFEPRDVYALAREVVAVYAYAMR